MNKESRKADACESWTSEDGRTTILIEYNGERYHVRAFGKLRDGRSWEAFAYPIFSTLSWPTEYEKRGKFVAKESAMKIFRMAAAEHEMVTDVLKKARGER